MGLCIAFRNSEYDDVFRIGYCAFTQLTQEIVKAVSPRAGELYNQWIKAGMLPTLYTPLTNEELKEFNELIPDDLCILLNHSDCDGKLTYKEAGVIWRSIKDLKIESELFKPVFERFKKLLRDSYKKRRNLYFF